LSRHRFDIGGFGGSEKRHLGAARLRRGMRVRLTGGFDNVRPRQGGGSKGGGNGLQQ
jgi:hypothetical protein